jgi:hypothetical protein
VPTFVEKHTLLYEKMADLPNECIWSELEFLEMTALWLFIWRSDGNFDVVTLQRRHSEGDMNNW